VNADNLFLKFPVFNSESKWQFEKPILFLGSCFSDEIAAKAKYSGLNAHSNPFGTIYHPLVIHRFLSDAISNNNFEERIELFQDRYYSFDAASQFQNEDKIVLLEELKSNREFWLKLLASASHLYITFGTAWAYRYIDKEILVANCLKMPNHFFKKELVSINEIVESWLNIIPLIRTINPEIEICFTVSPVRHIRDGIVENNRSKSILIEAVHQIVNESKTRYIPTYEIIVDVLRDYRFYKDDLVHPSENAIQIVWDWLIDKMVEETELNLMKSVVKVRKTEGHRPLNESSQTLALHNEKIRTEKDKLNSLNQYISW
jgi:hypothetical protein